jgi:hypothetical protein
MPKEEYSVVSDLISPNRFLSMTITNASRESVDQSLQTVLSRIKPHRFRRVPAPLHLQEIYDIEPPAGGAHAFKLVIYTPTQFPGGCVLITNLADGWNSLAYLIAREHQQFQVQVISTRSGAEYPQNLIKVWRNGQCTRTVMAMRDSDKWVFLSDGELESFEDKLLYKNRIKKDRLDRQSIIRYLGKIGWNIANKSFWQAEGEAFYYEEVRKR